MQVTGPAAFADGEWPQEMQISVDYPSNLLTLLFIRQSWQLETMSQLPELLLAPQPGTSTAPSSASLEEWSHRRDPAWGQAWEWARQDGAAAFGRGAFMAIRNPLAHHGNSDLSEHEALEQVFSVIAHWVAECLTERLRADRDHEVE